MMFLPIILCMACLLHLIKSSACGKIVEDEMNFQWGDKGISWTDVTWSPVTGCKSTVEQCAVRDVCYARETSHRFGRSFEPTFHPERLKGPYKLRKPAKIFVCSMGDLFGPWVPREWQEAVLQVVKDNPRHNFQFLTKFPSTYFALLPSVNWRWPANAWLGTTINSDKDGWRWYDLARVSRNAGVIFISAEPLLGPLNALPFYDLSWLIIGAQTGPAKQPQSKWVEDLLWTADEFHVPVWMKKNLDYEPRKQEWPV